MAKTLSLDLSKVKPFLNDKEVSYLQPMITEAHNMLHNKTGAGNDFLGWVDLPVNYDKDEFDRIKKQQKR